MRERKPETIIRDLKRQLKRAERERLTYHDEAYAQRVRAGKAEADRDEWKQRCDALIARLPIELGDK